MKILLVCSTGGHFKVMRELENFWISHQRAWVTFETSSSQILLQDEKVFWAWSPTNRHLPNLVRNLCLAWRVVREEKPDLILSTGAGVAVPFIVLGHFLGVKTAFVESITRVDDLSLSARLAYPLLDALYVCWPELAAKYPKAEAIISSTQPQEVS